MTRQRRLLVLCGFATLALAWLGPLPMLAPRSFAAHMTMHMAVVAVAAPLMALGLAGGHLDVARRYPRLFSAVPASVVELAVVWVWHTPALHHVARGSEGGLIAEQTMFFTAGWLVWMSAFGGEHRPAERAGAGVVALLLTSMHMTLLGALIALAPRPLYPHAVMLSTAESALREQQLGGVIMLVVGGTSYLVGGLWLARQLLNGWRSDYRVTVLEDTP
jgi:putative membrane protein